jgi:hypothetical protein
MRYRLMATYRGVPYEAGIGPTEDDVVLFAACPPPEELGFEPATGHWRKQLRINDVQALWESRPMGTFRGDRCIVLDDLGDRLHIAYLGHDAHQAEQLGYWQVDRGVFELLAPREEVSEIVEERVDYPHRRAAQPLAAGPRATGPYDTGPQGAGPYATRPDDTGPHATSPRTTGPHPTGPYDTRPQATGPYATGTYATGPQASAADSTGPHASAPRSTGPHPTGSYATGPYASTPGAAGPDSTGTQATGVDGPRDLAVMPASEPPLPLEAAARRAAAARTLQPAETARPEPGTEPPRRPRSALRRLATQRIFSELAGLAAIPPSAYAVGEEVDGAMCLIQTADGFEVFNAAAGARHEVRLFDDEESAYFYLFGVLAAEAVRTGRLAPQG